ncbi:MAG: LamG domain-containing protein [Planctomycetota bacterium]|nr:MAG: LamG domain-containing protein [Planctomycetota bacterium]REJ90504.1 MAG: LamG domain-containing protein [Planctomycetota bacterium]REK24127.1 MAG: LamG domain-containing protein [Planctomycetota bacterium]REK38296.1 MAG: LamG domain-containing protein [Planctomycetota bacterium]
MRILTLLALIAFSSLPARAADDKLLGHWPLEADGRDHSGNDRHLTLDNVEFGPGPDGRESAAFNGVDSKGWLDSLEAPDLGTGDFSISTWVHTAEELDDALGDVVSQFGPQGRRGFHLTLVNAAGVTSSQANYRNVHFGIDDAKQEEEWTDHGRIGNAVLIFAMAVHDGQLFTGTCEAGEEEAGRVFRFDGEAWHDCGSPYPCNSVASLAVYQGDLYAATSKYRLAGSSLTESENPNPGGRIYRYVADEEWEEVGVLPETEAINGMVVYKGRLYAGSMYAPAGFFRYERDGEWTNLGTFNDKRAESLTVYNGYVYATGYDEGAVYRFDGEEWTHAGLVGESRQTYGFATHYGELYVSEWPNAQVFRFTDPGWELAGRLGQELETMPLYVYNGKMYGGTLPTGEVYRYEGGEEWTRFARLDHTPDVKYRRVWSMAQYQGRLFAGVLPSGHIHSIEVGRNVTYDHALAPGWRHLAAVRDGDRLRLYIDGEQVAESTQFGADDYDLTTQEKLWVGYGANDLLNGRLRDLRLYDGALSGEEVAELAAD